MAQYCSARQIQSMNESTLHITDSTIVEARYDELYLNMVMHSENFHSHIPVVKFLIVIKLLCCKYSFKSIVLIKCGSIKYALHEFV
jgi:hypothetical protein